MSMYARIPVTDIYYIQTAYIGNEDTTLSRSVTTSLRELERPDIRPARARSAELVTPARTPGRVLSTLDKVVVIA